MKPLLKDHCYESTCLERSDIPGKRSYILIKLDLSPMTTCLEIPHLYGLWGSLSRRFSCIDGSSHWHQRTLGEILSFWPDSTSLIQKTEVAASSSRDSRWSYSHVITTAVCRSGGACDDLDHGSTTGVLWQCRLIQPFYCIVKLGIN